MMNVALTDSAAPVPKRSVFTAKSGKRLTNWGTPITVKNVDHIQKKHDERRNLHALHSAIRTASFYHDFQSHPETDDKTVGQALYFFNLPCGAKLAIWVPRIEDDTGKIAVYMTDYVGKQDLAEIQCDHLTLEIRRALGG
ncbi:MAG: hypothetical protein JWM46_569 [Candidatus Kaiserbacteria bacterium]|nr:hypothetical protein [Candidatus Kaiserbacteria bacterium]